MDFKKFSVRLSQLREKKGVSAREMSQACDLSVSYINNIENLRNMPSMENFFKICDYLEITPSEFFNLETDAPEKLNELHRLEEQLNESQLDTLLSVARSLVEAAGRK